MKFDPYTEKWIDEHGRDIETTVCKCEACGLFYKPSLGHKCKAKPKETELKPCPVCGRRIIAARVGARAWVWRHFRDTIAPSCPLTCSRIYPTREELAREINRRATDGKAQKEAEQ